MLSFFRFLSPLEFFQEISTGWAPRRRYREFRATSSGILEGTGIEPSQAAQTIEARPRPNNIKEEGS
jgi:hypothetical protein